MHPRYTEKLNTSLFYVLDFLYIEKSENEQGRGNVTLYLFVAAQDVKLDYGFGP